jgi:hypothetical protein
MSRRNLTPDEIDQLKEQGCSAENWNKIFVSPNFTSDFCNDVTFSGTVVLGEFGTPISTSTGIPKRSGIYNAHIHNCVVESGCFISSVHNHIANYTIEQNVFIENVTTIEVIGKSSFGNGTLVPVLSEERGRELPIFKELTAQMAYLLVFYRHRPKLIKKLFELIDIETEKQSSTSATISQNTSIINCGTITNVEIGEFAEIDGALRLNNGTINSSEIAPVKIGNGVIADNFIISEGSKLLDRTTVDTCFIGEGGELAKEFSADNSLFFSNFIGHHGEASSVFAGPHTATHHKSTLLISAYLSFLNAGSGSNQSNHLYKLGPLHHGVIARGSKTASNSYLLWPARIGVFTLITGRHTRHCDTSIFPYSYLIEEDNETVLVPGVNLKSVGTIRDADKWPTRDKRTVKRDIINYDLLNPYSVGQMILGLDALKSLSSSTLLSDRKYRIKGVAIPETGVQKGIHYYDIGVMKYVGNILVKRINSEKSNSLKELSKLLKPSSKTGTSAWIDMSGFLVPKEKIEELCEDVESGVIDSLSTITKVMRELHNNFYDWAWNWCAAQIEKQVGKKVENLSKDELLLLLKSWHSSTKELDKKFLEDAKKEFAPKVQIGFGIDGGADTRKADFNAVRGEFNDNDFIKKINGHLSKKSDIFYETKNMIEKLK